MLKKYLLFLLLVSLFATSAFSNEIIAEKILIKLTYVIDGKELSSCIFAEKDVNLKKKVKRFLIEQILTALFAHNDIAIELTGKNYKRCGEYIRLNQKKYYDIYLEQIPYYNSLARHILRMAELDLTPEEYFNKYLSGTSNRITAENWIKFATPQGVKWAKDFSLCSTDEKIGMLNFNGRLLFLKIDRLRNRIVDSAKKQDVNPETFLSQQIKKLNIKVPPRWEDCLQEAISGVLHITRLKESDESRKEIERYMEFADPR